MSEKKKLTNKERMQIPRQDMPNQKPEDRIQNFNEVPCGLTPEAAMEEAERCLQCPKPKCIAGCPVEVDIPAFIQLDHCMSAGNARIGRISICT